MDVHEVDGSLFSAEALRVSGISPGSRRAEIAAGRIVVVHRGWYVHGSVWETWHVEMRHAAQSLAAAFAMRGGDAALSHTSAAVLHGLPLFALTPRRVHVIDPRSDGRAVPVAGVARHAVAIGSDVDEIAGIPVTSLARTVGDLVGRTNPETAISLADAALRRIAWDNKRHQYDTTAADAFKHAVRATPSLRPGRRGVIQARWIVDFADGRADRPGESVSRLYLHLLGFPAPRLQVPVAVRGKTYYADFGLDDVPAWGEFDGEGKYFDADGEVSLDALRDEKEREDSIRAATGRIVARWGMRHLGSLASFRVQLARYGCRSRAALRFVPAGIHTARL
ncbi:MAG: hypothetical protein QM602_00615 [Microbacterium sp.]